MNVVIHERAGSRIAEVVSDSVTVRSGRDALELAMNCGADKIIWHQKNLAPEFFELKSGLAGEVLQKFSNYRLRLAIVGDFERVESASLRAFIRESNRGRQIFFLGTVDAAKAALFGSDL